jgi:hypothetical protein
VTSTNAFYWNPVVGGNGHFYEYVLQTGVEYATAKSVAATTSLLGRTGHLATVFNVAENDTIRSLRTLMSLGDLRAWIGLEDAGGTGAWAWVTGEPYVTADTNWNTNEPNNIGSERWTEMFASGVWNNRAGGGGGFPVHGYIVEYQFPF